VKKKKISKKRARPELAPSLASDSPTVEQLLADLPPAGETDTANALVEIYEAVERAYRAAVMAGQTHPRLTQTTNF
jgi:Mg-chelatase subunit ChlD